MKHIIKQIKKGAKYTRLSVVEKAAIKSQLLHYAKTHPARAEANYLPAVPSHFELNNFRNKKSISILIIGGLLTFGSVSLAAENTVPGDALYAVKIHINEQVRAAVAVTPKAKAEWDVRKAERRLEEVEKLALTPNVSSEIKIVAEENFNASANKVEERIANFEKEDDSEEAIGTAEKLAEMLRKHEGVFDKKSFGKDVTVSDSSFASASTTGAEKSASPDLEVKRTSIDNVRENIRGARGKAEEKRKELKNKYRKEPERKDGSLEADIPNLSTENPVIKETSSRDEISGKNYNKSFDKRNRKRKEEIRTTPREDGSSVDAPKPNEND
ncbi:MAG: hypothetical protein HZB11_02545 [Candidatus Yonathbacteria bacterium]|nr:hypothetical protein [Candidatus Yonathbacteria bacterium]